MKKNVVARRILLWTGVMFVLIAVLMIGLNGSTVLGLASRQGADAKEDGRQRSEERMEDGYTSGDASVPAAQVDSIDIEWITGSVNIELHDADTYEFFETSSRALEEREKLRYRVEDGTLSIQFHQSGWSWLGGSVDKRLTLRVPASAVLGQASVECVSSGLTIDGVQARVLEIESVSGRVEVRDAVAQTLSVQSVSGSMQIGGAFDVVDVESVSGSYTLALQKTPDELEAESTSGGITVQLPGERGFTARLDSLSGSISSDFAERLDKRELRYGDGDACFDFETISGSVNVNRAKDGAAATPRPTQEPAPAPQETAAESPDPFPAGGRGF